MASKVPSYAIGQTIFVSIKGREYQTVVEDRVWEKDGYSYSVNIPGLYDVKWIDESIISDISEEERELAPNKQEETKTPKKVLKERTKKMSKRNVPTSVEETQGRKWSMEDVDNELIKNNKSVEETPVEETPVEETPVEETPVEETPLDRIVEIMTPGYHIPVNTNESVEDLLKETPGEEQQKVSSSKQVVLQLVSPEKLIPGREVPTLQIAFNALIKLDDTPIPDAEDFTRTLNALHVEGLKISYEEGDDIPNIEVAMTNLGPVIVNGYHRQAALDALLKESATTENGVFNPTAYEKAKSHCTIEVSVKTFADVDSMLDYAMEANMKNGLPMSAGSRGRLAIRYMERAKQKGEKLSMRDAAKMARCSHANVSKALKKIQLRSKGKMVDEIVSIPEEVAEVEALIEDEKAQEEIDHLASATKQLFSSAKKIVELVDDVHALARYIKEKGYLKKEEDRHVWDIIIYSVREITSKTEVEKK